MALTEYRCTCGKLSADSDTGSYNEEHWDSAKGKMVKCNTNGGTIVTPDAEDSN